jgi:ATP adenylyltransferase
VDRLWAPWRLSYVAAARPPAEADACFLCAGVAADDDRGNLIAARTPLSVVVLNRFPYNNGHLLVAPRAHKGRPEELTAEEAQDLHRATCECLRVLDEVMSPHGYNVGLNLGKAAGAGLPGHLHWHVVPRWNGDTHFMPVVGETRVIVQSLEALHELVVAKWRAG